MGTPPRHGTTCGSISVWTPALAAGAERGAAYIGVDDADALHAEWLAAGVGETDDLFDPGFGVWEAAHHDPDGNLVRFGSPVRRS